jgi:hypothetical protein
MGARFYGLVSVTLTKTCNFLWLWPVSPASGSFDSGLLTHIGTPLDGRASTMLPPWLPGTLAVPCRSSPRRKQDRVGYPACVLDLEMRILRFQFQHSAQDLRCFGPWSNLHRKTTGWRSAADSLRLSDLC